MGAICSIIFLQTCNKPEKHKYLSQSCLQTTDTVLKILAVSHRGQKSHYIQDPLGGYYRGLLF